MLSHRRIISLIDTYGADLRRWPEAHRSRAAALLRISEPARAHREAARSLDVALQDAARMEDAQLWGPGDQQAALARIRSLVGSTISNPNLSMNRTAYSPPLLSAGWFAALALRSRRLGLAVGCSLAVAVGIVAGSTHVSVSASHNVMTILQPALLQVVTD